MNKKLVVPMLCALVTACAAGPSAQVPPAAGQTQSGSSTTSSPATAPATTLSIRGTIDNYDRLTRVLVLTTPTATYHCTIHPSMVGYIGNMMPPPDAYPSPDPGYNYGYKTTRTN
jgi:hypothetical protein